MMKKSFGLLLAAALFLLAFAAPVSAGTTGDGFVYTVFDTDTEDYVKITGYTGNGGDITIPSKIEGYHVYTVEDFAFAGSKDITSVVFSDNLFYIGSYAFADCTALSSISVGKLFCDLGEHAFENCTALTTIDWNAKYVFFDPYSDGYFANAGTAGSGIRVTFGDEVETIPDRLFYTEDAAATPKVVSVTFGANIEGIGQSAFKNCPLTSVVFPDHLKNIWDAAFSGCHLSSVEFNDDLESINDGAFSGCLFTSLTFPDRLSYISSYAFAGCGELAAITFGNTDNLWIQRNAFLNCSRLTSVTMPRKVDYINEHAFGYCYEAGNLRKLELTMTGYTYSAAAEYAQDNGFAFVSVGGAFADVEAGKWYEPYIDNLVVQGIFSGYKNSDGTHSFQPDKKITRAEFAAILARAAKADLSIFADKSSFSDVAASDWAAPSIEWAFQRGIVTGTGNGKYAPEANITRQDMAVMICRFVQAESLILPAAGDETVFADAGDISSYALAAVTSLHRAGIISGSTSGGKLVFQPKKGASRAEAAKMISVLLDL